MPIFYQQHINAFTKLAVWHIEEDEQFFLEKVPFQRHIAHPHKRLQHLAGRYLLQYLYPDFPFHFIQIADSRQPYLPEQQYHFSISHSDDYAAAIISTKGRVGVDVEKITSRVEKVKHVFLHPEECAFAEQMKMQMDSSDSFLTLLWGVKEALYKWWGNGGIDASEQLRFEPFQFHDTGYIKAVVKLPHEHCPVSLEYKMFDNISLVWAI